MENKHIEDFYDNFIDNQQYSGVNDRIFSLYKRLKKLGLNKNSNVLELGCGIGCMTFLLSKTVKKGKIEAIDISPDSISYAKSSLNKPNINFYAHDVVDYKSTLKKIDFILLLDVVEHIPKEKHFEMFKNIARQMSENTILIINIPNPDYIEYDQKKHPDELQIIDQPIHIDFFVNNLVKNNLNLIFFEKYSIWVKDEYNIYFIEKKKQFERIILQKNRNIFNKILIKLFRIKLKIFYNYTKSNI